MTLWIERHEGQPLYQAILHISDGRFMCVVGLDELNDVLYQASIVLGKEREI